ncbi:ATP-dependent RNA helicase dbp6 [Physcia stellaris]|nr:ATP-dependent RNA helicase dbp6 [Physcia stellaris]
MIDMALDYWMPVMTDLLKAGASTEGERIDAKLFSVNASNASQWTSATIFCQFLALLVESSIGFSVMSNLFYSRYIPPSKVSTNDVIASSDPERPRKRPKIAKPAVPVEPEGQDARHKKLRSKYEKSKESAQSEQQSKNQDVNRDDAVKKTSIEGKEDTEQHGLVPIPQPAPVPEPPKPSISSALPDWIRNPVVAHSTATSTFADLPLPPDTVELLKNKGFRDALPIQNFLLQCLLPKYVRQHGDLCVSAPTGSGKTLAYALPMVENLKGMPARRMRGLVVVPTQELVAQSKEVLGLCARGSGLKIGTATGKRALKEERDLLVEKGQRYDIQAYIEEKDKTVDPMEELMDWDFDALKESVVDEIPLLPGWVLDYRSKVDILICTPGRLVEHIKSTKGFNLHSVQWMVIDEADRLLDDSFQQWVNLVIPQLEYQPPLDELEQTLHRTFRILRKREVRKILLSATMTRDVSKLMALRLSKPKLVVLDTGKHEEQPTAPVAVADGHIYTLPPLLTEIAVNIDDTMDKPLYLLEILEHGVQLPGPSHNKPRGKSPLTPSNDNEHDLSDSSSASDSNFTSSSTTSSSCSSSTASNTSPAPPSTSPPSSHGTLIFTSSTTTTTRLTHLLTTLRPHLAPHIHAFTKYTSARARRKALSAFSSPPTPKMQPQTNLPPSP